TKVHRMWSLEAQAQVFEFHPRFIFLLLRSLVSLVLLLLLLLLLLLFNTTWYRFNGFLYRSLQRASISAKGPFWCLDRGVHLFIIKIIGHLYSLPFFCHF